MNTKILINEAISLPVEERTLVVESLLKSLNKPEAEIDSKWITVAQKRLKELQEKQVTFLDGNQVFKKIWSQFAYYHPS